jgi:excisionase family DNA binding protein
MDRRFLTSREVAEYLGLSEPTIRAWVRMGKIPCYRLGRAVRFDLRQIETWVKKKAVVFQDCHLDDGKRLI